MKTIKKHNLFLIIPLIILNIISLLNMINAPIISSSYNNAFIKQFIWIILGYLLIFITKKIKFKNLVKYSLYLYAFSIILLIIVLFVGKDINGAKCWLNIFGLSFQPSELVKLTMSLELIKIINATKCYNLKDEFKLLIKILIITLIPSILVFLEPDTGAIINYFIILLISLIYAKLNKRWYISFFTILILGLSSFFVMYFIYQDTLIDLIGTSFFYRMDRILNFANKSSYQLENALITIGSSSFVDFKYKIIQLYIPEAPTDFFFAFTIGNFGILSAIIILICFLLINIFLIYKNNSLKNNSNKMFISIFLGLFIFHQIYNIFMNIGLLPIMGIPLPFLSYGGTNMLINYLFLGIILNLLNEKNI